MEKIRKSAQQMINGVFKRLESRQKPYEKIIINNMQSLYQVIRKGDIVLVEGNSDISRMIKLLTQSSWSHSAFYVGDELIKNDSILKEQLVREFGSGANHMVIEAFTGAGVIASPLHKYEDYNIRVCRPFGITGTVSMRRGVSSF